MIAAFAEAGIVLDEQWTDAATETLAFVRERLWDAGERRLNRRYRDGTVGIEGYLDDYAYSGRGAIRCYEATGDIEWLTFAVDLADAMVDHFWDPDEETLHYTPARGESLVSRPGDPVDQSTPSSLAVGLGVLATLDAFVPGREFESIVERSLDSHTASMSGAPLQHVSLVALADRMRSGPLEWTIVADSIPDTWRATIASTYAPDRLVARRPPGDGELDTWLDRLGCEEVPPIWADRTQRDGRPTAYVCRAYTCSPPLTDPTEATDWLDQLSIKSS